MKKHFLFLLFFLVLSHHCFPQTKSNLYPTKISYFLKLNGQTRYYISQKNQHRKILHPILKKVQFQLNKQNITSIHERLNADIEHYLGLLLYFENKVKVESTTGELFIKKATKIIDKYLDKSEFDVEKFASEMNSSSVQLRRKLKAITDQTITEFVCNYCLEIASEMLEKKMGTVSEIT